MRSSAHESLSVSRSVGLACELRSLARDVHRIGSGLRADPEAIAIQKDEIATRLRRLAHQLEVAV